MTKAEEIYTRVNELMDKGMSRTQAFTKVAVESDRKYDSVRGSYYTHKLLVEGRSSGSSRSKRRETTPEDALADARVVLERSIEAIDREVQSAEERATEAVAEAKALKASAAERKKAITEHVEALK